jgi:hypothetical protein
LFGRRRFFAAKRVAAPQSGDESPHSEDHATMVPAPHSKWRRLLVLLIIAFLLRLAAGWAWQTHVGNRFAMGDSESYWQLGRAMAHGQPYEYEGYRQSYRVFRAPGYPLLLAPIIGIAGEGKAAVLLARGEAALLGTLAVLGVWWLARLLFDDRAAWIAAILATFYPEAIAISALVLSEAPFGPLMLLQLGLWVLASKTPSRGRRSLVSFGAGLAGGAATLMRPDWLLFTPLMLTVGVFAGKAFTGSSRRPTAAGETIHSGNVAIAFWMLVGLTLVMFPWWVRNARVTGRFVPTTLQVGASLYDGQSPNANGSSDMGFVQRFVSAETPEGRAMPGDHYSAFEVQLDRRLRDAALQWASANPGRTIQLAGIKFLRMWNLWPNERQFSAWPVRWAVFFTYTPLLIFAIIGACRTLHRGWPYILCWLPAVYLTLLHMIFVSSIRYREPAMLALLALAAGAITEAFGKKRRS